jgi:hypothetical protein
MKALRSILFASTIIGSIACVTSPALHADVNVAAKSVGVDGFPANKKHKPRKFTVTAHRLKTEYVDMGATGASTGDLTVITGEVLNDKDQSLAGSFLTRVLTVGYDSTTNNFTYELYTEIRFTGPQGAITYGQILSDGPIIPSEQILTAAKTAAIYGGTGEWIGAGGYVTVGDAIPGKPDYRELTFNFK